MIDLSFLKYAGPYLGALATSCGFIFIYKQIKQNRLSVENQARGSIYQLSHSTYKLFIDRPELRPFFYTTKQLPNTSEVHDKNLPNRDQILAAAELLVDYFEHITLSKNVINKQLYDSWIKYITQLCHNSDAIQVFLKENGTHYTNEFKHTIQKQ